MTLQRDSVNKILSRLESVQKEIQSIRSDLKYIIEKEGNQKS
nr:MAG TPA: Spindle and kinetochore-associated protein 2 [Caudoviricetes sp.]